MLDMYLSLSNDNQLEKLEAAIPLSLIFSFNLANFGLKQNPTGLQEAI